MSSGGGRDVMKILLNISFTINGKDYSVRGIYSINLTYIGNVQCIKSERIILGLCSSFQFENSSMFGIAFLIHLTVVAGRPLSVGVSRSIVVVDGVFAFLSGGKYVEGMTNSWNESQDGEQNIQTQLQAATIGK